MKIELIANGYNFRTLCSQVIDADTINNQRTYQSGDVVFCKTDYLGVFFAEVRNFKGELKLVSHQSDYPVGEMLVSHKPSCVKKWFAQNVDFQHPNLIPIPIGVPNHSGPSVASSKYIDLDFVEKELPIRCKKQNKIYANFNTTHWSRFNVLAKLKNCENVFFSEGNLSSSDYHREMAQYMFVASPRGNGIDCHRTWEALLVGSIPIVERHFMYDFYPTLPIVQIDSWDEVLEKGFLEKQAEKILTKAIDLSAVYMPYWIDKIKNT